MKTHQPGIVTTIVAGEDLVKNRFVTANGYSSGTGLDVASLGVTLDDAFAGEIVPVAIGGIVLVEAGAAFDLDQSDVGGLAYARGGLCHMFTSIEEMTAVPPVGVLMDNSSAAGDIVRVKLL